MKSAVKWATGYAICVAWLVWDYTSYIFWVPVIGTFLIGLISSLVADKGMSLISKIK